MLGIGLTARDKSRIASGSNLVKFTRRSHIKQYKIIMWTQTSAHGLVSPIGWYSLRLSKEGRQAELTWLLYHTRRYELVRRFFRSITISDSCLHDLLPQRRDSEILSRLRRHTAYPIPRTKTNKISFFHTLCPDQISIIL